MQTAQEKIESIKTLLLGYKISYSTEAEMQGGIEAVFVANNIPYEREKILSKKDRVDFLVNNIAIECKISGGVNSIHRQISRYAEYDNVHGIILYTSKHMGSLETLNDKPVVVIKPGAAWL
jgi:hypothetical protein